MPRQERFGARLKELREEAFIDRSVIAADAGVSVRMLADIEMGFVGPTGAVYDVAVRHFRALSSFSRPRNPDKVPDTVNPHIAAYMVRLAPLQKGAGELTMGKKNKVKVLRLVEMAMTHDYTQEEFARALGLG